PTPTPTPTPEPIPEVCTQTTLGSQPEQVPDFAKDCNILMAAKDTLRGMGTLNWSVGTAIRDWDGVTVSDTPSRVTELALPLHGLTGSVPAQLGSLSALLTLDLSWNKLTGGIPASLGDLGELRSLSLYRTSLGGSIPPELGDLAKLEHLSLSQNFLSGAIPAELGMLTKLEGLYLYQNRLTGTIPKELGSLSNLENLVLGSNRLDGDIPEELGNLTGLASLHLSGNTFTGCLPGIWADVASNDLADLNLPYCSTALEYNTYDTSGGATTAGSHALLEDSTDMTSAPTSYSRPASRVTAIVVNTMDGGGQSRAAFYSSIKVGDIVEWVSTDDEFCWQRFKVTGLLPDPPGEPPRKLFAVAWLPVDFDLCTKRTIAGEQGTVEVELRWHPPAARKFPDTGDIPVMLMDQPVGPGTYYAAIGAWLVIDVPAGMTLVRTTGFVLASTGFYPVALQDVKSGSSIVLALGSGTELGRTIETVEGDTRDIGALFDQIVASARIVEGK
ncbi:MAG: hypothetical protein F4Y25_04735, partial [Chloroflexi bacterium]|nr:hypothetical protein [Chloroflexota bacterium]